MKLKTIIIAILASSFVLVADGVPSNTYSIDRSPEAAAARKRAFVERTGGFIDMPGEGPDIVIVDSRSKKDEAPAIVQETVSRVLRQGIRCQVSVVSTNSSASFSLAKSILKAGNALIVIVIFDGGSDTPTLGIFPEDRIGLINWSRLSIAGTEKDSEDRTIKELWRAIGFLHGVGYSMGTKCVMQPIVSPVELDANEWKIINPSSFPQMTKMAGKFGVKRGFRIIYEKAVRAGIAPQPTNDIQRAVWDRVMAEKAATNAPAATTPAK